MTESKLREIAMSFAVQIVRLVKDLKAEKESVIADQLGRCGTSIGARIYEANYVQGKKDSVAKLELALREANETGYWIELLYQTEYINEETYKTLQDQCTLLRVMLTASCNTPKNDR